MSRATQPPLFPEPCPVCRYAVPGEHEPYCPSFMRGAEPGGDPHEWPTLLDAIEEEPTAAPPPMTRGATFNGTPYEAAGLTPDERSEAA